MKKKNSEVQSRRDFFKKAVKASLPIIGIAVLASNPVVAKAAEAATDCNYGCGRSCSYGCSSSCAGSCQGGCKGSCYQSCKGGCSGSSKYGW